MLATVAKSQVAKTLQRSSSAPSGARDTSRVPELPVQPPHPKPTRKMSVPKPPEAPPPPKDEPPAASSQDERKEPEAEAPSHPIEAKVDVEESDKSVDSGDDGDDQEPKEKKAKKSTFDLLNPPSPASPANDADKAEEDPQSDSEDERIACKAVLEKMDKLVALEEARDKKRLGLAVGEKVSQSRLDVLLTLMRLMQMHVQGEDDKLGEIIAAGINQANDSATSQKSTSKDDATSPGPDDDDEPLVPQAHRFMEEKGFTNWDELKDGCTLMHHCCYDATKRNMFCVCFQITCMLFMYDFDVA